MSAIFGLRTRDGAPLDGALLPRMAQALAHRGPTTTSHGAAGVAIGCRQSRGGDASGAPTCLHVHSLSGMVVVADARIDNREELATALGVPGLRDAGHAELILAAYLRWGEESPARLIGDFAFAIWDEPRQTLFCARDPMGVKPLYFHLSDRLFAFSTEPKGLLALPQVGRELDEEQVALHLAWGQPDPRRTIHRAIDRLPAAHALRAGPASVEGPRRYWALGGDTVAVCRTPDEYVERFRALFLEAVRCRLPENQPVATALSGGLDSSAITCAARTLGAPDLHAVSLVFPDLPADALRIIDERQYVESVVSGGGVHWHPVRGDALSPLGELGTVLWHLDEPFAAPNLYLHWGLYGAAAAAGAAVFLDGLDGDATVGHGLGRLNELLRAEDWSGFEGETAAFAANRQANSGGIVRHYVLPHLDQLAKAGRWQKWTRAARALSSRFQLSRREVLIAHGLRPALRASRTMSEVEGFRLKGLLTPAMLRYLDERAADDAGPSASERELHIAGLTQPAYQATLELADRAAAAFGLEPRYPFFDRRLMEFCVDVPGDLKFSGGWTRWILRRSMEGILPREVQWRSDKANLAPNFHHGFRGVDRALVEATNLDPLSPFVDVPALRRVRREYFSASDRQWGDADSYLLFRSVCLARWQVRPQYSALPCPSSGQAA